MNATSHRKLRNLPRQGIFTPTPIIEYDGTLTSTSGKIILPFTIERINYKTQTNTRQFKLGKSTQQFFYGEDTTTLLGYTKINVTMFKYDRATNIYTGQITVEIGNYGVQAFSVPQDPNSTAQVGIILYNTYWEIPTSALSLYFDLKYYPQGTYGTQDISKQITL